MLILVGLGAAALSFAVMFIARPRNGEKARFLSSSAAEITYSLLFTGLFTGAVAAILAGLGRIAGF